MDRLRKNGWNQREKQQSGIVQILFLTFVLFLFSARAEASGLEVLRISLIEGDVQIETKEAADWTSASINFPMREGDRIWVGPGGKAELQLIDGTTVRLNEKSALEILTTGNDSLHLSMDSGQAYVQFRGRRGYTLQWVTPSASIEVYEPSRFRIDLAEPGDTQISTYQGVVDADGVSGKITVRENQTLFVRAESDATFTSFPASDEWERWNLQRDRRIHERAERVRYLPEEIEGYADDLDEHGRWQETSEYGPVWVPAVAAYPNWSPYQVGRWVLIGNDYVWVSNEPWGWVPYHYGRWAFVNRVGWCWVPPSSGSVFWGPGYVAWVHTTRYVAWVPLAPGEVYYGRGYYGPDSINITTVTLYPTRPVYRNLHVSGAVTVVQRPSFFRGEPRAVAVRENPFTAQGVNPGLPPVQPNPPANSPGARSLRGIGPSPPRQANPPVSRSIVKERPPTSIAPPQGRALPAPAPTISRPSAFQEPIHPRVSEVRSPLPQSTAHLDRRRRIEIPPSSPEKPPKGANTGASNRSKQNKEQVHPSLRG